MPKKNLGGLLIGSVDLDPWTRVKKENYNMSYLHRVGNSRRVVAGQLRNTSDKHIGLMSYINILPVILSLMVPRTRKVFLILFPISISIIVAQMALTLVNYIAAHALWFATLPLTLAVVGIRTGVAKRKASNATKRLNVAIQANLQKNDSINAGSTQRILDIVNPSHIQIKREISKGSYGKVGKARFMGRDVAVKEPNHNHSNFKREVNRLEKLDHPNIVRALARIHPKSGVNFSFVMPYFPDTLRSFIKRQPNMPWSEVFYTMHQISSGLEYLHGEKIMHRDLKSDNIMLDRHGVVKICDFGDSSKFGSRTKEIHGTSFYIADEVLLRKKPYATDRADIWSLGMVGCEFRGRRSPEQIFQFLMEGPNGCVGNLPPEEFKYFVEQRSQRKKQLIPAYAPQSYQNTIKDMWKQTPENRPDSGELRRRFSEMMRESPRRQRSDDARQPRVELLGHGMEPLIEKTQDSNAAANCFL